MPGGEQRGQRHVAAQHEALLHLARALLLREERLRTRWAGEGAGEGAEGESEVQLKRMRREELSVLYTCKEKETEPR